MSFKEKKGFLLFEIMIVMILVALISSFLLSGYNLFLKTGKKSLAYLTLTTLLEEKIADLKMKEAKNILITDLLLETQGSFSNPDYKWYITWENTKFDNVKRANIKVVYNQDKNKSNSLQAVLFVYGKEAPIETNQNNEK